MQFSPCFVSFLFSFLLYWKKKGKKLFKKENENIRLYHLLDLHSPVASNFHLWQFLLWICPLNYCAHTMWVPRLTSCSIQFIHQISTILQYALGTWGNRSPRAQVDLQEPQDGVFLLHLRKIILLLLPFHSAQRSAVAPYSSAQQTFINLIHQYENIKVPYFHGALRDHFWVLILKAVASDYCGRWC